MIKTIACLLSALITLFSMNTMAQDEVPIVIKSKIIRMAKYPIADIPKKTPVNNIRIVQFVRDSANLGFVLKGLDNQVATISPAKPLTEFLQTAIDKMYQDDYKAAGPKLLFVLKDLRIGERTGFTEFSYMRFRADAYASAGQQGYNYVSSLDTVLFSESGGDVTAWHGEEIEMSIKLLLHKSLKIIQSGGQQSDVISFDKIQEGALPVTSLPVLNEPLKDGEYLTFNDFLQNTPSLQFQDSLYLVKTKLTFKRINNDKPQDSIAIWGLCKNGRVYKWHDGELIALEKEGPGFILSDYARMVNKKNSDAFTGALIGGVAGALIAGAGKKEKPYLVTSIPHISKPKKQPLASVIDMQTGELSF